MGLHGEPVIKRDKMCPAYEMTVVLYERIKTDLNIQSGDEVCVLINGLGSTTLLEISIVYRRLKQLLERDGITIFDADLGSYCTCQEMGGLSITLMKLDDQLKTFYQAPCQSPSYYKP